MEIDMLTERDKKQILILWEKGLTGSQIAEKIKTTRCSVLGFISRKKKDGLIIDRKQVAKKQVKKPEKRIVLKSKKVKTYKERKEIIQQLLLNPVVMPTRDGGVDLMGLKNYSCRFIISPIDHPVRYCGVEKSREPYCAEHYALCYYPARKDFDKSIDI